MQNYEEFRLFCQAFPGPSPKTVPKGPIDVSCPRKGKPIMHSDNGSEFAGAFDRTCQTLEIIQVYSRPRTPKDNPALEKFNDTVQREWLARSEVGLDDIEEANKDLTRWLVKYVSYRPHESLDYQTPLEYAQEQFFKVLPMWSARSFCIRLVI